MPESDQTTRLDERISGDSGSQLAKQLRHHESRIAIREVVVEHISSTDFADRIKKIQSESLKSTETYGNFSDQVQNQIDKTLSDRGLKSKNLWIPIGVSIAIGVATVAVAFYK